MQKSYFGVKKKRKHLPRFVLNLQQRIPSCAAITTVDVLRRAFKNSNIVCLENVTLIVTLISCVSDGLIANVIKVTNCLLTERTVQVG